MTLKDFKVIEVIGKGSFASVYKVLRRSDNKVYALKRVKISKMSKKEISDALNEIRFLASIRHKNIVGFLQAFLENNESELCIVMEYCGCGDLSQKVERYKKKKQYIDEDVIWKYLVQCLKALQHLHDKGICHRDLKTANTFLSEDGSVKIGDMNVSKSLNKGQLKTQIGTPYYMSPEIWNNKPYDSSSDIWSLGCMIYELCALRPPFTADSFPALKRAITNGRYSPIPSKFSDSLQRVIAYMLKLNPKDRYSAEGLLKTAEINSKLHLDVCYTSFANQENDPRGVLNLIGTIKVPQNLNKLNSALPKPCYPDVRPNSPTSWTVAEQKQLASRRPSNVLPPMLLLPINSNLEGLDHGINSAPSTNRRSNENFSMKSIPTNFIPPAQPTLIPKSHSEDNALRPPLAKLETNKMRYNQPNAPTFQKPQPLDKYSHYHAAPPQSQYYQPILEARGDIAESKPPINPRLPLPGNIQRSNSNPINRNVDEIYKENIPQYVNDENIRPVTLLSAKPPNSGYPPRPQVRHNIW